MTKKRKNRFLHLVILFFFCYITLFSQSLQTQREKLQNLSLLKDRIIEYHSSGQYDKDIQNICNGAWDKLKEIKPSSNSTVIFDVDETALSNYSFLKNVDFGYIPFLWNKWIDSAKAPAIKPVKALYDSVLKKGFKIVFLTGRWDFQYTATIKNLKKAGFAKFDTLIAVTTGDTSTAALFKERERIKLTRAGYSIICTIGDQYSDMKYKYTGIKVKLVDYMYYIK